MEVSVQLIRERLSEIRPAGLKRDLVAAGLVRELRLEDGRVHIVLLQGPLPRPILDATTEEIRRAIGAFDGVDAVEIEVAQHQAQDIGPIPGVESIVAVSSTKGGVGKSTVAVNLACALALAGKSVGLLDADVYGPSTPTMLGLSERPQVVGEKRVQPLLAHGVRFISMGLFVDDTSPVIWRGPLVTGILRQFLKDVAWGELDVLVVDLPPGTGDAQLTLVQHVPVSGALVVTTPQEVSLIDVERGMAMFRQVNTTVFGIVENMSGFACSQCGDTDPLFGEGGGEDLAGRFEVPLLAKIPIVAEIRSGGDAGVPIVVGQPDHMASETYKSLAGKVADAIAARAQDARVPQIIG